MTRGQRTRATNLSAWHAERGAALRSEVECMGPVSGLKRRTLYRATQHEKTALLLRELLETKKC